MKWNTEDVAMFLQEKEYIDTVVLPLNPISFGEGMKQSASMMEFIALLSEKLERQFKGRLLMLPIYTYLDNHDDAELLNEVMKREQELSKVGFKHIMYITSDSKWRSIEGEMAGELIWLPSIPLQHMNENDRQSIVSDQVKQLIQIIIQKWHLSE